MLFNFKHIHTNNINKAKAVIMEAEGGLEVAVMV